MPFFQGRVSEGCGPALSCAGEMNCVCVCVCVRACVRMSVIVLFFLWRERCARANNANKKKGGGAGGGGAKTRTKKKRKTTQSRKKEAGLPGRPSLSSREAGAARSVCVCVCACAFPFFFSVLDGGAGLRGVRAGENRVCGKSVRAAGPARSPLAFLPPPPSPFPLPPPHFLRHPTKMARATLALTLLLALFGA